MSTKAKKTKKNAMENREVTLSGLVTDSPRWCHTCGDFGILMALKKFMVERQLDPARTVHVSGIGCSGRIPMRNTLE